MINLLFSVLLLSLCANSYATEVAWVKIADSAFVGHHNLRLNGAGVRSKFFLDLYIAALYLRAQKTSETEVFADDGEKRMALHMMRDIYADQLLNAFSKGIEDNHAQPELVDLAAPIKQFSTIFMAIKEIKRGDVVTLDYQPGRGTQISVNGMFKGIVAGKAFYTALLKIWLGNNPAQEDLKLKLLGR